MEIDMQRFFQLFTEKGLDLTKDGALVQELRGIRQALELLASSTAPAAPSYVYSLDEYFSFDWASIDARVVKEDRDGPTHVEYRGRVFTRRSPQNKYGAAIWYSRSAGENDKGETTYERLITFKNLETNADPIDGRIERPNQRPAQQPAQAQAARQPASNPPAGKPQAASQAPAGKPQGNGASGDMLKFLTKVDYFKLATGQKFGLSEIAAGRIADLAGVVGDNNSFRPAAEYLPYFAECKAAGKGFPDALDLLRKHNMDWGPALIELRSHSSIQY